MFFSFQIYAEKENINSLEARAGHAPGTRHHTDSQSERLCVRGSKWRQISMCA